MHNLRARLLETSRKPIANARVRLYSGISSPAAVGEGMTDSQGSVTIPIATPDRWLSLSLLLNGVERFVLGAVEAVGDTELDVGTLLVSERPFFQLGSPSQTQFPCHGVPEQVLQGIEAWIAQRDDKGVETTFDDFVKGTADHLANVRSTIREGGFDLGPVTLEMKALVPAPGQLRLIGSGELSHLQGDQLSTIRFQVEPIARANSPAPPPVKVPSVAGYTEALARKKLQGAGLAARIAREVVAAPASGPTPFGRVVRQDPPQDTSLPPGSTVTLFLGERAGQEAT